MPLSKRIQTPLKILITVAAFSYIVIKLVRYEDLSETSTLFSSQLKETPLYLLVLTLLLMPINWWLEMKKWRCLILSLHPIKWSETFRAVFAGLTIALLTPNRIGENFSRVFVLPKEKRLAAVGLSGVNSLAQIVIIQVFGMLGIIFLLKNALFLEITRSSIGWFVIVLGGIISALIVFIYLNINKVTPLVEHWKILRKYIESLRILNKLDKKIKWTALGWAFLKYFVYINQFYLLLLYFGVYIPWYICYPAIMTVNVLLNYMPVIAIGEAGVRGSVTLLVFGQFSDANLSILAASFGIWTINIVLPAIVGGFLLPKVKF